MNGELLSILELIERDKGIDREVLIQAVETALATAARKSVGASEEQEVLVTIDRKSGQLSVAVNGRSRSTIDFSRIAAQTAKQVIIQKIREAERDVVFTEYQSRVGDIVTGTVHRFERGDVIVELGRAEAILPKSDRIPHEEYQQGERLQGYVLDVRKTAKGPAIVLSRAHEGFIRGLFHLEVPEIAEGIVEVKGIAREAGDRTKIAVASKDDKVDCVGACVGMRGTRVRNIVRELHGEKIDIIRWHDDIKEFIGAALSPAKIAEIQPAADMKQALVIVDDDQLSLAIGKKGQNVRLASKLCGWQLEIKSRSQIAEAQMPVSHLPGIGPTTEERLAEAGIRTVHELLQTPLERLTAIKGIGEKTAQKLLEIAKETIDGRAKAKAAAAAQAALASHTGGTTDALAAPTEPQPDASPDPAQTPAASTPGTEPAPPAPTEESTGEEVSSA
jgi:N utilization substance protein A